MNVDKPAEKWYIDLVFYVYIVKLYFFIAAQIAQVAQPIQMALVGQLGQQ